MQTMKKLHIFNFTFFSMVYNIEVSINLLKHKSFTEMENTILGLAEKYGYESIYDFSETDGTLKIPRYHHVIVVSFLEENLSGFIKFIESMKKYNCVHIESIYNNQLIYASSYYLTTIDKGGVQNYRRKRSYSEDEQLVYNAITC